MAGMTIKQWHRREYLRLCAQLATIDPAVNGEALIQVSIAVHVHKGHVPRSWWPLANKHLRRGGRE
jgi:hypothetical protein